MGKLRKVRAKAKSSLPTKEREPEENRSKIPSLLQVLPKDADIESVRSFKSIKNKFGIQKQIKKRDKIKIKKEILKQKIDIIKDFGESAKSDKNNKIINDIELLDNDSTLNKFLSGRIPKKIIPDPEEEYVKLGKKAKGVEKKQKRRKQMIKDVNILKNLMTNAKRSVK